MGGLKVLGIIIVPYKDLLHAKRLGHHNFHLVSRFNSLNGGFNGPHFLSFLGSSLTLFLPLVPLQSLLPHCQLLLFAALSPLSSLSVLQGEILILGISRLGYDLSFA